MPGRLGGAFEPGGRLAAEEPQQRAQAERLAAAEQVPPEEHDPGEHRAECGARAEEYLPAGERASGEQDRGGEGERRRQARESDPASELVQQVRHLVEAATALRRRVDPLLVTSGDVSSLLPLVADPGLLADVSVSVEERLVGGLSGAAAEALRVLGTWGQQLSPVDQGTGLLLALQVTGGDDGVRPYESANSPDAGLVSSLERCALALGVEFRPSADALCLEGGRVLGVECEGELARAETVLSFFDARHTYLDWVGARHLPLDLVRSLESARYRGGLARWALLLDGELTPPEPAGVRWIFSEPGTADRVSDEARLGRETQSPWLDVLWASTAVAGSAPRGTTLLTVSAQSFPYALRDERSDVEGLLMQQLRRFLPLDEHRVLASELILPEDFERRFGLTEGHLHGGEMGLDQLFALRGRGADLSPSQEWLPGLELCSGSVHPGGLTLGLAGRLCALRHLEEAR